MKRLSFWGKRLYFYPNHKQICRGNEWVSNNLLNSKVFLETHLLIIPKKSKLKIENKYEKPKRGYEWRENLGSERKWGKERHAIGKSQ